MKPLRDMPVLRHIRLFFLTMPIRLQLVIAITFLLWLTIIALSILVLHRQQQQLYAKSLQLGKISLNFFTNNALLPLANDDILTLNKMVTSISAVDDLVYAIVVDKNNLVKAHTDHNRIDAPLEPFKNITSRQQQGEFQYFNHKPTGGSYVLNISRPVRFKDKVLGRVHVGVSLDYIAATIRTETTAILILSALIVLLGIGIAILLGMGFARPINQLVHATGELSRGNFEHRLVTERRDEFGHLAQSFNYMAKELKDKELVETSFGRYVSPEVVEMILSNANESWLKGSTGLATIMFTDLRGFTAFVEKNDPAVVVRNLNEYFAIATTVILEFGGRIDKFIGDAVLGVFGLPLPQEDHALRAVQAGLEMQRRLQQHAGAHNPLLGRVGIGVDTGRVVAGTLGSKVKMEYTVIGDGVNVASRINALARAGELLISRQTYRRVASQTLVQPLEPQLFKGKSKPIEVFRVTGLQEDPPATQ